MKTAGLFAGIGGVELGLVSAGAEAVLFAENWDPAAAVLRQRFPDVPNVGDVRSLRSLPADVDIVTAGFPCQDLSQAGRTAGIDGTKSGLVGEVFRLLDTANPRFVVLENVSFMLSLDSGSAMERLVRAFEDRGFHWAYRVVNSLAFVPQRRERVFFVASRTENPADIIFADESTFSPPKTTLASHAHGFYWTEGVRGLGWAPDSVPTLKNGSTIGIASPPAILMPDGLIVTPDIRDAERLQGFPADWTKPAETVGRASWRWSLVGNAVTVPVAGWLGRNLFAPREAFKQHRIGFDAIGRWPRAACRIDGRRFAVAASEFPVTQPRASLVDFLEFSGKPLSERAALGFLARTRRSKLRFVEGFQDAVARYVRSMHGDFRTAAE